MEHAPLARTDTDEITPDHLENVVDYSIFNQLVDFHHRGTRCNVNRTISFLGAAMEQAPARELNPVEAVEIVTDAFASKYPAWFGEPAALDNLDQPISNHHLSEGDLRDAYWQDTLAPTFGPIDTTDWTSMKQIIIPFLGLALDAVDTQRRVDKAATVEASQGAIKRTIIREAIEHDLDTSEITEAVDEALDRLESRTS